MLRVDILIMRFMNAYCQFINVIINMPIHKPKT